MVYESDFYTTRRPYRTSPSLSTYTVSRREIPWEKVPFVPRPSLVPDPITAFGKRKTPKPEERDRFNYTPREHTNILSPLDRARIRPKFLLAPSKPYVPARDETRERVLSAIRTRSYAPQELPSADGMDIVLPKLHKLAENPDLPYKRRIVAESEFIY
ncbi:uncharacterized protein CG45078 isoform X12 [Agrilus planipennis]|uniref:Uncharacterized protein CG45078 isoform X12 n=1 Tax=Agrilus planipennis TaxID=224129 RepID=A0A1W4XJN8_AGRPL|nr:uncharacterized protein CG45078 isoform X12 [Agrilus planipennis]